MFLGEPGKMICRNQTGHHPNYQCACFTPIYMNRAIYERPPELTLFVGQKSANSARCR
jgi:hypothetical protein